MSFVISVFKVILKDKKISSGVCIKNFEWHKDLQISRFIYNFKQKRTAENMSI